MNSFGRLLRIEVLGESHGECLGVVVDGCPAGLRVDTAFLEEDLKRRQGGTVRGTTPRKEADIPLIKSGMFNGLTTGAPILVLFENRNIRSEDYSKIRNTPRPGHADWTALKKFGGFNDYRGGGHFSGRLTAGLVAAGALAKQLIAPVKIRASVLEAGGSGNIEEAVERALQEGDSLGGVIECRATGLPAGLGEPFFDSVESMISHGIFAIPAVKAIEFGDGWAAARMKGSEFNDDIIGADGSTATNHSGGINGGITSGADLVFRIAVKPTSSIRKEKRTVNMETGEQVSISTPGRHDACIALRAPVVVEAVTALVLADLMLLEQKMTRVLSQKTI